MRSISGLPSHVLFVHAPVVLMPLTLLGALLLAVRPKWRRRSSFALAGAAAVVLLSTILAVQSGQEFDEIVGDRVDTSTHESLALGTQAFVIAFFVSSSALAVADRWQRRGGPTWLQPAGWALTGLTVIVGALATLWMVRTGDEGARLVWKGVISMVQLPR